MWVFLVHDAVLVAVAALGLAATLGGAGADDGRLALAADLERWVVGVGTPVGVAWAVLCVRWLLRAVRNVEPLTGAPPRHSPAWAVWSWFIPVVWWVVPKRVVDELWSSGRGRQNRRVVDLWWAGWLLGWAGALAVGAIEGFADEGGVETSGLSYVADLGLLGVSIATSVLSIVVIRRVSERQAAARLQGA